MECVKANGLRPTDFCTISQSSSALLWTYIVLIVLVHRLKMNECGTVHGIGTILSTFEKFGTTLFIFLFSAVTGCLYQLCVNGSFFSKSCTPKKNRIPEENICGELVKSLFTHATEVKSHNRVFPETSKVFDLLLGVQRQTIAA